MRVLEERPVAGGERFSAVIGPDPRYRRLTRAALAGALLAVAFEVVRAPGSLPPTGRLALAAGLFGISLVSGWLSGGTEQLFVEGGVFGFRRAGVFSERRRMLPLRELQVIGDPPADRGTAWAGFAVRTTRDTFRVGVRLSAAEARWLAAAFRRHVGADPVPFVVGRIGPDRAGAPEALSRLQVRR